MREYKGGGLLGSEERGSSIKICHPDWEVRSLQESLVPLSRGTRAFPLTLLAAVCLGLSVSSDGLQQETA